MKILAAVAALMFVLAFAATTILYFTGPTTVTVTNRHWRTSYCANQGYVPRYDAYGIVKVKNGVIQKRTVCVQRVPAGFTNDSETVRANAWERISGRSPEAATSTKTRRGRSSR